MPMLPDGGRIQDDDEEDALGNKNQIVADLIANGRDSIPFVIDQLSNQTEVVSRPVPYFYHVYVGDIASIILDDFFTDETGIGSTIPDFGWDEFLERGNDNDSMAEEVLRRYIRKHGRRNIKERWQKMWNKNKENIFWDEPCRCFRIQAVHK